MLSSFYNVPALKKISIPVNYTDMHIHYGQQKSDDYIWQKGSGSNIFDVQFSSFQQKNNTLRVWGAFDYKNSSIKDVNFNETLDYDYLYPYIMADTVGGDLRNEQYAIAAGLSKTYNKSTYGAEASFVGKQSVRNRDPRIQNISANVNITLSVSQALTEKYNLALSLFGDRYFQQAKVAFNSELGRPTIFHETGLGNYNKLFANTKDEAEYLGYNYGVALHFVPTDQIGWFGRAKYSASIIDKKIKDVSFVINQANKQGLSFQAGYKSILNTHAFIELGLDYDLHTLTGLEGRFHSQQSQLIELDKVQLFNSAATTFGGYISFLHSKDATTWTATFKAAYAKEKETYVLPFNQQQIAAIDLLGELRLNQKVRKSLLSLVAKYNYINPLSSEAIWTGVDIDSYRYAMLTHNFKYKSMEVSSVDVALKLAMPVKKLQTFFIGANAGYASAYNLTQFGITSGFVF